MIPTIMTPKKDTSSYEINVNSSKKCNPLASSSTLEKSIEILNTKKEQVQFILHSKKTIEK
jgi:hypothetical protein